MRRLSTPLIVVASLLFFIGGFAAWVARQALDTDEWVDTSSALVRDPDIQEATSAYLADQLVDQDALTPRIREILPDRVDVLAAPAAGALAEVAERTALRLLRSGAFQTLWEETNRLTHEQLVDLVEGDKKQDIVFDLRPMLGQLAQRVGLGPEAVEQLPEDRGRLVIMDADELNTVRAIGRALKAIVWVLVILGLLLQVAAVYVASDRRRALLRTGIGLFIAGLALLLIRRLVGEHVVETLTSGGAAEPAAAATWEIGTGLLREISAGILFTGVIVMLCAWLAGPSRLGTRARTGLAPTLRESPGLAYTFALGLLLVLLAVGVVPGGARIVMVLIYVVLVVAGVAALRRQVTAEAT